MVEQRKSRGRDLDGKGNPYEEVVRLRGRLRGYYDVNGLKVPAKDYKLFEVDQDYDNKRRKFSLR